jgi:hypothetical protein
VLPQYRKLILQLTLSLVWRDKVERQHLDVLHRFSAAQTAQCTYDSAESIGFVRWLAASISLYNLFCAYKVTLLSRCIVGRKRYSARRPYFGGAGVADKLDLVFGEA